MSFSSNGHGGRNGWLRALAGSALGSVVRRPTLAAFRRYADWVEQTSSLDVHGPGAAYAGRAVYVCRPAEVPLVFLHRAHYDDRTHFRAGGKDKALALFAQAAGLVVTHGDQMLPEIERAVRAGNGALFVISSGEAGMHHADLAAALAWRARAPVIPIFGRAEHLVWIPYQGVKMGWPRPRNALTITYGQPAELASEAEVSPERVLAVLESSRE